MQVRRLRFPAIGTRWVISVAVDSADTARDAARSGAWDSLERAILDRIETFDKHYSRFRPDSLVTRAAARPGTYALPADGYRLLRFYEKLYGATGGLATPLIGSALSELGYDATYTFERKNPAPPPAWAAALSFTKRDFSLRQPVLLDFGAAGKGYLVDIIARLLADAGYESYTINAGGDILQRGSSGKANTIGLENPQDTSQVIGTVQLHNQSLAASAGSRRRWGGMHHIINPGELRSPEGVLATWVMADETMTADGLATALFLVDAPRLRRHFRFSYAILRPGMELEYSADFPIKVFKAT